MPSCSYDPYFVRVTDHCHDPDDVIMRIIIYDDDDVWQAVSAHVLERVCVCVRA